MTAPPPVDPWSGRQPVPRNVDHAWPDITVELGDATEPGWKAWWARRSRHAKAGLVGAAALTLFFCCGGLTALFAPPDDPPDDAARPASSQALPTSGTSPAPVVTMPGLASPTPTIEVRTVTETEEIPFEEETVDDPDLPEGASEIRVEGRAGERALTYEVTYTDGVETDRELVGEQVTRDPVDQVLARGTKPEPEPACHPSYAGACVPFASDVDCEGGSGNGPAYVRGPVYVVGPDVYDLDGNDNDGVACEP